MAEVLPLLRRERVTHVVMAGGIGRRPRITSMRPSLALLALLPRSAAGLAQGRQRAAATLVGSSRRRGFEGGGRP